MAQKALERRRGAQRRRPFSFSWQSDYRSVLHARCKLHDAGKGVASFFHDVCFRYLISVLTMYKGLRGGRISDRGRNSLENVRQPRITGSGFEQEETEITDRRG